jgi:hypothetical protein
MCSPLLEGGAVENLDRYARLFLEFLDRVNSESAVAKAERVVRELG